MDAETAGPGGFVWEEGAAGPIARFVPLASIAAHAFTTRQLSFRESAGDDYRRLAGVFGVDPAAIVRARQVHGRGIQLVRPGEPRAGLTDADALVSTDPAFVITVRVADCVPVLMADRGRRAVAAVHAGWRGLAAGAVPAAVAAMVAAGVTAAELVAAIGPCIGPCCYQVDERVRAACLAATPDASAWFAGDGPARWRLDLAAACRDQLCAAGVPEASIGVLGMCTADRLDLCHSYRAEGESTGRLVAAIRLDGRAGRVTA